MVKENRESYNSELRSYRNQLNIKMKAAAKKKLAQYMRAYGPPTFETIKLLIRDFNLSIEGVEVMFNRSLCYAYQIFDEQRMDAILRTIDDPYKQKRYVQNICALKLLASSFKFWIEVSSIWHQIWCLKDETSIQ